MTIYFMVTWHQRTPRHSSGAFPTNIYPAVSDRYIRMAVPVSPLSRARSA